VSRRRSIIALGVALAATPIVLYLVRPGEDDYLRYHNKSFAVVGVIGGDTIELAVRDSQRGQPTTRVRLWGVQAPRPADTPRVGAARAAGGDYFGLQAAEFTRRLASGQTVGVELVHGRTRDKEQRLLAYVYLPDKTMINEEVLRTGHGYADTRTDHPRLERFKKLEERARKGKPPAGLWEKVPPDQLPDWWRAPSGDDSHAG